jgi:hypothetical protein
VRAWPVRVLAVLLFVWEPMRVATELLTSMPTLGMRGPIAIAELAAHAVAAAIAVAAGRALWTGAPHGPSLAIAALVASTAVSLQSLYASALPQQTSPGQHLPFAILAVIYAAGWIAYLRRTRPS